MSLQRKVRSMILGDSDLPQQCAVGLRDPQTEVRVELHGLGEPRDVTARHMIACASPFTIGIGLDGAVRGIVNVTLKFFERAGEQSLLAAIDLVYSTSIPA